MRDKILIFISYPTYYQMSAMLSFATAFNRPLSFNTTKVTVVRVYLFGVRQQWETRFWFPISYSTYHQMNGMFAFAAAFNQPLSTFNTAEVTMVRVFCVESDHNRYQILIFYFLSYLDGPYVQRGIVLQSTATFFQYCQAYICEIILVWSQSCHEGDQILWLFISYQTYYQMTDIFFGAKAFNQDLCHFGVNGLPAVYGGIFTNSGCFDTSNPTSPTGPWCAVTTCPP